MCVTDQARQSPGECVQPAAVLAVTVLLWIPGLLLLQPTAHCPAARRVNGDKPLGH